MRKIPTLFARDWDGDRRYVLPQVTPGCEWVIAGEGTPTRKYDGTCVLREGNYWLVRREVKEGKPVPDGFVAVETDPETGKTIGWEPIGQSGFAKWHAEATGEGRWGTGTYELIGPKINGNPEGEAEHRLVKHEDAQPLEGVPTDHGKLAEWLHSHPYEGIVWHHPDGRMAKIKARDFPRET